MGTRLCKTRCVPDRDLRRALAALLAVVAMLAAGCGSSGGGNKQPLLVSAATSLKAAFTRYAGDFAAARVRVSFLGSDQIAAQIRQGVRPDVFASANTKLPAALFAAGLVQRPVVFAGNRLVLAVPSASKKVRSLGDLARPGVTLAVGAPSVPIGAYTRTVISKLGAARSRAILANVRSEEPGVDGIVGKLTQGAVDAGFLYITDVQAAHGALRAIGLPAAVQPQVAYAAAVVRGAKHASAARRFIAGLLHGAGQRDLRAAGFEPPPR